MNWDALGAIGEIVGAIAVVGTLGYLALQIRSQNRQANASMQKEIVESFNTLHVSVMTNQSLANVIAKVRNGNELSDGEVLQWESTVNSTLNSYVAVQRAYDQGQIDRDTYDVYRLDVPRAAAQYGWEGSMKKLLGQLPDLSKMEIFSGLHDADAPDQP